MNTSHIVSSSKESFSRSWWCCYVGLEASRNIPNSLIPQLSVLQVQHFHSLIAEEVYKTLYTKWPFALSQLLLSVIWKFLPMLNEDRLLSIYPANSFLCISFQRLVFSYWVFLSYLSLFAPLLLYSTQVLPKQELFSLVALHIFTLPFLCLRLTLA